MATTATITPDWERDGFLVIEGASTIDLYLSLKKEQQEVDFSDFDMFCAFSEQQFDEGLKSIRPLAEGEKIYSLGSGIYGTKDGIDKYMAFDKSIEARIKAECDPQEVYWYEWNNHECCINWEGDYEPIKIIGNIFGWDVAAKIKRRNACATIDDIRSNKPLP